MPTSPGFMIGRVFGIPIYVNASWLFIFVLFTYTLKGSFAHNNPQWSPGLAWGVGTLTSLIFFGSVLFHELSHSVVAQYYKIRVVSITLFIFGGVARIERDPTEASQEFNIAIAGPLSSGFLAGAFYALTRTFPANEVIAAVANWLWETNLALAVFNLLPGAPLDGGRIFRAAVWAWTKDFNRATRAAGTSGRLIAYTMILVGAYGVFHQDVVQGGWLMFVGWFVLNAAQESVAQVAIRETLSGLRAADVMSPEVPTIARDISLEDYGQEVLRTGRRCHLVVTEDRLVGMMNVHTLNSIPRDEWANMSVQAVMIPRGKILWASPDESLLGLLERLLAADVNQMPVISGNENGAHIIGMVTRDSILRVMRTRSEVGPLATSRS